MSLVEDFKQGDRRALARIITHIENRRENYRDLLKHLARRQFSGHRIGITGPPGSGKSTLVDRLAAIWSEAGRNIGIIAVDPSSPFTGGALLGDRIRMQRLVDKEEVFIRSMASRGQSGGLAAATRDVITAFESYGMDLILIETVGIGQIELDIVNDCDTVVVVLVPESGDMIQTMKAGLMEIADIFCVNKMDRPGSERLIHLLNQVVHEKSGKGTISLPAIGTNGVSGEGVDKLQGLIEQHRSIQNDSGELTARRQRQLKSEIMDSVRDRLLEQLEEQIDFDGEWAELSRQLTAGETDPYSAAEKIYEHYFRGRLVNG